MSSKSNNKIHETDDDVAPPKRRKINDDSYFECYEDINLHASMIGDTSRTMTYKRAILNNYRKLYKARVADVGCGTSILSLFCAQAGAKQVFAIEFSGLASVAKELVAANGLQDRIEVLNIRAEDASFTEEVDAIVSEWMGYGLLYENMLWSVLDFRDKHLKKDGLMFPQTASIFIAALGDECGTSPVQEIGALWKRMDELYDAKLDATLTKRNVQQFVELAHVEPIPPQALISRPFELFCLDLLTIAKEELSPIKRPFKIVCFGEANLIGIALWFDVGFPGGLCLSTSPSAETTHWEQVAIYFKEPVKVAQDSVLEGEIVIRQADNFHRYMNLHLTAECYSPCERHEPTVLDQHVKFR